jgi:signal transduction histidine kinase
LESAFEAQRRFVAHASHELRTPLTLERALLEVILGDPDATTESFRSTCEEVLAVGEQQERLIETLIVLARSQRGLDRREPFDLSAIARDVLEARRPAAERRGLHVDAGLSDAPTSGDPSLVERLVANLVDNAVRHNVAGGQVQIVTGVSAGHPTLFVANSGPVVPPAEVDRLFQPFQRLAAARTGHSDGHGLGLSIVHAVATAHGAVVAASAQPAGGLAIEVRFLALSTPSLTRGTSPRSRQTTGRLPSEG